ncbi:AAA domain-containing protein [Clostridium cellulovorans]|uniref:Putative DNA helicase n=1 Tax=Clostridium cellulovorans (strain ATCC 35296 / DSM 3052 / OCM 3 / 743B) TaxID=573061 RepID=D9SSK8_CLOC7|nr:AAA domain-containing protein [Clostridium cellulovorans]ADL50605.1 putative DNA helicase [Clostridium cellulovorans 743B]
MRDKVKEITSYLRSAVAAQVNKKIKFEEEKYFYFTFVEFINGKINEAIFKDLTKEPKIKKEKESISVIIVTKTIKTIFESQERKNNNIEDLTGVYYVPAILNKDGTLQYDEGKLPWIPREFLQPMIEPKVSMGHYKDYDNYISESIGRIHKIKKWQDYVEFVKDLYEYVTSSKFDESRLLEVELEKNIYIIKDNTVNATGSILNLYDNIINECNGSKLYENFVDLEFNKILPLIPNDITEMSKHCGQMGGEYPLSPSQRECINHFTNMVDGEMLAVNGPPGTGKTTLLQSMVANLYVERALKKEKPPLIVASSTNNQAVTNIIESFGKIKSMGYGNLEERWIEGVNSFAVYFPSSSSEGNAKTKVYHYTNLRGENFISDVESEENILKSKERLLANFNKYFGDSISSLGICEEVIHASLCKIELIRRNFLELFDNLSSYEIRDKTIEEHLVFLKQEKECLEEQISMDKLRIEAWRRHFKGMPLLYRLLKFLKSYKSKIATRNRMFIESEETFLDEYMSLEKIEEKYSYRIMDLKIKLEELQRTYKEIEHIKKQYDDNLIILNNLNIDIFQREKKKSVLNLNQMNEIMDKTLRYIEFWLSVHYYECRWVKGEDKLTKNQKGKTYKNILDSLYNRLSMITPCYVMTFYQLPRNFLALGDNKNFYLYNYIDLLIVDEAGQVSPEIAACSFALAKKAVVVGDIYQIEPVWSVCKALDISLSLEKQVILTREEYEKFSELGINTSSSSVMKVASKCCKYMKFGDRGLFLSEHRRCYNEIISYCKDLVYRNLEPMRGNATDDKNYKLNKLPQMGYKQIDTEKSSKRGGSRYNKREAIEIANWINENFQMIRAAYPMEDTKSLLGIITPFKAQVTCIASVFSKHLPEEIKKNISVGTVHTFQGAERRIIIMSTVYGGNEECYFIDANKSMLNVAVSRAKDSFLVFGNINSFNDNNKSGSGLLKQYIIKNTILDY